MPAFIEADSIVRVPLANLHDTVLLSEVHVTQTECENLSRVELFRRNVAVDMSATCEVVTSSKETKLLALSMAMKCLRQP